MILNALATGQAAAASPTSGTFTATANGDIYVFVGITGSAAGEALPTSITCTDGGQGAFNLVYSQVASTGSQITVAVYRSRTSSSPVAGSTITANVNAANTDCELIVAEVPSGFNTVTPTAGIPASPVVGATTTPLSVTLSQTPAAGDLVIGVGASRNRLSASPLTAGTAASFTIATGLHLERAAAPSASISVEQVTGYTGTTVDMGNFNTVYSDLNAFIIQAAPATGAPAQPANPGLTWRRRFLRRVIASLPSSLTQLIGLSDTGAGVDNLTVSATVPLADTGSGADALTVAGTIPLPGDTGTGADALTVTTAVPLAETGTATDGVSINASTTLADTAAGADAISAAATVPLSDAGAGSDTITVSATITLADTGTAVDAIQVGVPTPLPAETGTGSDALTVSATIPVADTATGADTVTVSASVTLADTATGSDAVAVSATVPLADARTGADALTVTATVNLAETAAAADALAVSTATALPADTGHGTDTLVVTASVTLADLATAADAIGITALVNLTDTATGTDGLTVQQFAGTGPGFSNIGAATGPGSVVTQGAGTAAVIAPGSSSSSVLTTGAGATSRIGG